MRRAELEHEISALIALEYLPDASSEDPLRQEWPYVPLVERALRQALNFMLLPTFETIYHDNIDGLERSFGVAYAPSLDAGLLAVGLSDGRVVFLDSETFEKKRELLAEGQTFLRIAFTEDGSKLASTSAQGQIAVWDVDSGAVDILQESAAQPVVGIDWSKDGNILVAGDYDGNVRTWDMSANPPVENRLVGLDGRVGDVRFSPVDNRLIAFIRDIQTLDVWNIDDKKLVHRFLLGDGGDPAVGLAWSPDGQQIAAAVNSDQVKVFDLESGRQDYVLSDGSDSADIWDIAYHPDPERKWVATVADNSEIRIWSTIDGEPLLEIEASGTITSAAWSPDGERLLVSSAEGSAQLYEIWDLPRVIDLAKNEVTRCFSEREREVDFADELPGTEPPDWCIEQRKTPYDAHGRLLQAMSLVSRPEPDLAAADKLLDRVRDMNPGLADEIDHRIRDEVISKGASLFDSLRVETVLPFLDSARELFPELEQPIEDLQRERYPQIAERLIEEERLPQAEVIVDDARNRFPDLERDIIEGVTNGARSLVSSLVTSGRQEEASEVVDRIAAFVPSIHDRVGTVLDDEDDDPTSQGSDERPSSFFELVSSALHLQPSGSFSAPEIDSLKLGDTYYIVGKRDSQAAYKLAEHTGPIQIRTKDLSGTVDSTLTVTDTITGAFLGENDDSEDGLASNLVIFLRPDERARLEVRNIGGTGGFVLELNELDQSSPEMIETLLAEVREIANQPLDGFEARMTSLLDWMAGVTPSLREELTDHIEEALLDNGSRLLGESNRDRADAIFEQALALNPLLADRVETLRSSLYLRSGWTDLAPLPLEVGQTYNVIAEVEGEATFDLPEFSGAIAIQTKDLSIDVDSALDLREAETGIEISRDDDGGEGLASNLLAFLSPQRRMQLRVRNIGASGTFDLAIAELDPALLEGRELLSNEVAAIALRSFDRFQEDADTLLNWVAERAPSLSGELVETLTQHLINRGIGLLGEGDDLGASDFFDLALVYDPALENRIAAVRSALRLHPMGRDAAEEPASLAVGQTYDIIGGNQTEATFELGGAIGAVVVSTSGLTDGADSSLEVLDSSSKDVLNTDDDGGDEQYASRLLIFLGDEEQAQLKVKNIGGAGGFVLELEELDLSLPEGRELLLTEAREIIYRPVSQLPGEIDALVTWVAEHADFLSEPVKDEITAGLLEEGSYWLDDGDEDTASSLFDEALTLDPSLKEEIGAIRAEPYLDHGIRLLASEGEKSAAEPLERALALDPSLGDRIQTLRSAFRMRPEWSQANADRPKLAIGQAYYVIGDKDTEARFDLSELDGSIMIQTRDLTDGADSSLAVFDSQDDFPIAENDDDERGLTSRLEISLSPEDRAELKVKNIGDAGGFVLELHEIP